MNDSVNEPEDLPVLKDEAEDASMLAAGQSPIAEDQPAEAWRTVVKVAGILLFAVTVAGLFIFGRKKPPRSPAKPKVTGVRVAEAAVRDVKPEVTGLGRARPARSVLISAQVAGLADEVDGRLKDGAYLKKGLVVVRIDEADYSAQEQRQRALLDVAKADKRRLVAQTASVTSRIALTRELVKLEKGHLSRTHELFKKGAGTDRDIESAELSVLRSQDSLLNLESALEQLGPQIDAAHARILEAEARHATAKLNVARATIALPFSGQVANVSVEEHQLVAAGAPLFELWQVDQVEVPVALSLRDATLLAGDLHLRPKGRSDEAEQVSVEHEGKRWTGVLQRFEPVDGDTQTVKAVVLVKNPPEQTPLLPSVFCRATLRGAASQRALTIPAAAIQEQGRVYVVREGKLATAQPELGPRLGSWVIVKSGLEAGDQVIVSPLEKVVEGSHLTVTKVVE